jgi:hypothetical protein
MSLPPKVRELRAEALRKLQRGERVKGALGASQRAQTQHDKAVVRQTTALHLCKCGCGELTRATFKRGHAARYYQRIRAYIAGKLTLEDLSPHMRRVCINRQAAEAELGTRFTYGKERSVK